MTILSFRKPTLLCFCLVIIICLFTFSCTPNVSRGRAQEQFGDIELKNVRTNRRNYHIGLSQSRVSFDEAFFGAMSNAQIQISNELGFNINVSTVHVMRILETSRQLDLNHILHQEVAIDGEHANLRMRINRLYYERTLVNNEIVHNVWVELFFDSERFLNNIQDFWVSEIRTLRNIQLHQISQQFIINLERILSLRIQFENEKRYLPNHIITDFENGVNSYRSSFSNNLRQIRVDNIICRGKFSNQFTFRLSNNQTNEILINFPVKINDEIFFTNHDGILSYTANYNNEIMMSVGHSLDRHIDPSSLIIYRNSSFSPFFNQNVTLNIVSDNILARNSFENLMRNRQFIIGDDYDLVVVVRASEDTRMVSINQFLSDVRLEIDVRCRNNRFVTREMQIPGDRNTTIRGHGNTERNALINAYSLEWLGNKELYLSNFERIIREFLVNI